MLRSSLVASRVSGGCSSNERLHEGSGILAAVSLKGGVLVALSKGNAQVVVKNMEEAEGSSFASGLAISDDGQCLCAVDEDKNVRAWEWEEESCNLQSLGSFLLPKRPTGCVWCPYPEEGNTTATGESGGRLPLVLVSDKVGDVWCLRGNVGSHSMKASFFSPIFFDDLSFTVLVISICF